MAVETDWISVAKAAELAGCSEQYIRKELLAHIPRDQQGRPTSDRTVGGRIDGWLLNARAWSVSRASALALKQTLSTRARLHEPARTAKKVSPKAKSRRKVTTAKRKKTR